MSKRSSSSNDDATAVVENVNSCRRSVNRINEFLACESEDNPALVRILSSILNAACSMLGRRMV